LLNRKLGRVGAFVGLLQIADHNQRGRS
jgi:hypothetical protein